MNRISFSDIFLHPVRSLRCWYLIREFNDVVRDFSFYIFRGKQERERERRAILLSRFRCVLLIISQLRDCGRASSKDGSSRGRQREKEGRNATQNNLPRSNSRPRKTRTTVTCVMQFGLERRSEFSKMSR